LFETLLEVEFIWNTAATQSNGFKLHIMFKSFAENCGSNVIISPFQILNITSPGWPNAYSNNLDCTWYIETNQYREVEMQIVELNTQLCCDSLHVSKFEEIIPKSL